MPRAWQRSYGRRRALRSQIEDELASLKNECTERIKFMLERQKREVDTFDTESVRLGFSNLSILDYPKDDYR